MPDPRDEPTLPGRRATETARRADVVDLLRRAGAPPMAGGLRQEARRRVTTRRIAARVRLGEGSRVGPYTLEARIGRGGMSEVYRARRPGAPPVALKLIGADLLADADALARFRREVDTLSALDAVPGVVRAREAGRTPCGRPYFVMDLVSGESLTARLRAGIERELALDVVGGVAARVACAHARGFVHRDLKPSNVLLDERDQVWLIDFGLAKALLGDAGRITHTGEVLGTPSYMAPEQAGESPSRVGPWTDVFALGAMLYQVLTDGRTPHQGETPLEVYERLLGGAPIPPPRALVEGVPPELETVAMRALASDPAERYPDAEAFAVALAAARRGTDARRPLALRALVATALVTAALATSLVVVARARSRPTLARASTAVGAAPAPRSAARAAVTSPNLDPTHAGWPAWFSAAPPATRPAELPAGVRPAAEPGLYRNARDGSTLRWIPAGTFHMGSSDGDADEHPVLAVDVAGFFLGEHEVTWAQYERFCQDSGHRRPPSRSIDGYAVPFTAGPQHPVFHVSWQDARAYCAWAGLRLPTESEWEYAARGHDERRFPWGDALPTGEPVANLADASAASFVEADWGNFERDYDDGHFFPTPVGSYPRGASPFGCLDMAGNVWEWVADRYGPYGQVRHGQARVLRGGSWDNSLPYQRATGRGALDPDQATPFLGFRVAR